MTNTRRPSGLRRFATCIAMRMLGALMVVWLPMHAMTMSVSSIVAPAHYHLPLHAPAADAPFSTGAPHEPGQRAGSEHEHHHDDGVQGHRLPPAGPEYTDHHSEASERLDTLKRAHHENPIAHEHHHDSVVGHHSHRVDEGSVVYRESDRDHEDPGPAGNHASPGTDAALPARGLPISAISGTQILPEAGRLFASRESEPPLRPPSRASHCHA